MSYLFLSCTEKEIDIIDVDFQLMHASWATGENIALNIIHSADSLDKFYESDYSA